MFSKQKQIYHDIARVMTYLVFPLYYLVYINRLSWKVLEDQTMQAI